MPSTADVPIDVKPGTNQAEALGFLYANSEYGFKPAELRQHTSIPANSARKVLARLYEKDAIGKTADGYYHALDDLIVAQYAQRLDVGDQFPMDTGEEAYPDTIDETTTGFPEDDTEIESLVEDDAPEIQTERYADEE